GVKHGDAGAGIELRVEPTVVAEDAGTSERCGEERDAAENAAGGEIDDAVAAGEEADEGAITELARERERQVFGEARRVIARAILVVVDEGVEAEAAAQVVGQLAPEVEQNGLEDEGMVLHDVVKAHGRLDEDAKLAGVVLGGLAELL